MNAKNSGHGKAARGGEEGANGGKQEGEGEEMLPLLDDLLAPDEIEHIGDLGNGDDDDEGPEAARLDWMPGSPRERYLLKRFDECIDMMKAAVAKRKAAREERVPEEVWRRLGDEALGLAPSGKPGVRASERADPAELDGFAEFKRGLAVLHEVAVLQAKFDDEMNEARRRIDQAREAMGAVAKIALKAGRRRAA